MGEYINMHKDEYREERKEREKGKKDNNHEIREKISIYNRISLWYTIPM